MMIKVINEMFTQRGYTNINEDVNFITATKQNGHQIKAFKNIIPKLNVSEIQNCISNLQETKINHGLVIYDGIPTSVVKVIISNIEELNINIELFQSSDLQFNITKHVLVPQHVKLQKTEAQEFKNKYSLNIPILLKNDPISKFFDFSRGDIIKVIRRNGFISYRIVR